MDNDRPLSRMKFPSDQKVSEAQQRHSSEKPAEVKPDEYALLRYPDKRIWIPDMEHNIILRIIMLAHGGVMGHRGIDATTGVISAVFRWNGIRDQVKTFIEKCLYCQGNEPTSIVQRPYGETINAKRPNEVIHFDFVEMDRDYLLVIKDGFSKFVILSYSKKADTETIIKALELWFSLFGSYPMGK